MGGAGITRTSEKRVFPSSFWAELLRRFFTSPCVAFWWGLCFTLPAGARYRQADCLPIPVPRNREILGQRGPAASPSVFRARRDLGHRGTAESAASGQAAPQTAGATQAAPPSASRRPGSAAQFSVASRFLSSHLICIWDIN